MDLSNVDLRGLSDSDLQTLATGQLENLSDQGLHYLKAAQSPLVGTYDVPLGGGMAKDGSATYIDRTLPATIKINGKDVDPRPYLRLHENTEWSHMQTGMAYDSDNGDSAHKLATQVENDALRHDGIDPVAYNNALKPWLTRAESDGMTLPKNLDSQPYHQDQSATDHAYAQRIDTAAGGTPAEQTPPPAPGESVPDYHQLFQAPQQGVIPSTFNGFAGSGADTIAGIMQRLGFNNSANNLESQVADTRSASNPTAYTVGDLGGTLAQLLGAGGMLRGAAAAIPGGNALLARWGAVTPIARVPLQGAAGAAAYQATQPVQGEQTLPQNEGLAAATGAVLSPLGPIAGKLIDPSTSKALMRAVSSYFGEDAPAITPQVINAAHQRIGNVMDQVVQGETVPLTGQNQQTLQQMLQAHQALPRVSQTPDVVRTLQDLVGQSQPNPAYQQAAQLVRPALARTGLNGQNLELAVQARLAMQGITPTIFTRPPAAAAAGGAISAEDLRNISTTLGKKANDALSGASPNSVAGRNLQDLKETLDDMIQQSVAGKPIVVAGQQTTKDVALAQARQQYRALSAVEDAAPYGGNGQIPPQALMDSIAKRYPQQVARGGAPDSLVELGRLLGSTGGVNPGLAAAGRFAGYHLATSGLGIPAPLAALMAPAPFVARTPLQKNLLYQALAQRGLTNQNARTIVSGATRTPMPDYLNQQGQQ